MIQGMQITAYAYILMLLVTTGIILTLYIMRRRVRLGKRKPKF